MQRIWTETLHQATILQQHNSIEQCHCDVVPLLKRATYWTTKHNTDVSLLLEVIFCVSTTVLRESIAGHVYRHPIYHATCNYKVPQCYAVSAVMRTCLCQPECAGNISVST